MGIRSDYTNTRGSTVPGHDGRFYDSHTDAMLARRDAEQRFSDAYAGRFDNKDPMAYVYIAIIAAILYAFYWIYYGYFTFTNYLADMQALSLETGLALPAVAGFTQILKLMLWAAVVSSPFLLARRFPSFICPAVFGYGGVISIALLRSGNNTIGPITFGHDGELLISAMLAFAVLGWLYFTLVKVDAGRSLGLKHLPKKKFYHRKQYDEDTLHKKTTIAAMANTRVALAALVFLSGLAYFDSNFRAELPVALRTGASYLFFLFLVLRQQIHRGFLMDNMAGFAGYNPPILVYFMGAIGTVCALIFAFVPYPHVGDPSSTMQLAPPLAFFGALIAITAFRYFRTIKRIKGNAG